MDNPPPLTTIQQFLQSEEQIRQRHKLLEDAFQVWCAENPEATEAQKQRERVRLLQRIRAWQER